MYLPDGRIQWPNNHIEWPMPFKEHEAEWYRQGYLHNQLRKGRGLGSGPAYLPWIEVKVNGFSSRGVSGRFQGIVVDRIHHTLSRSETNYVFLQERKGHVKDIREHWPILDMNGVHRLNVQLGIPIRYERGHPLPPSIDVLLTEEINGRTKYRAVAITAGDDAQSPRVRQELQLQYLWCTKQGIPWTFVKDLDNEDLLQHLVFIRQWHLHGFDPTVQWINDFARLFLQAHRPNAWLIDTISATAHILQIDAPSADLAFKYCAWSERIRVNAFRPIALNKVLYLREH